MPETCIDVDRMVDILNTMVAADRDSMSKLTRGGLVKLINGALADYPGERSVYIATHYKEGKLHGFYRYG